ncbi:lysophospholipase I [Mycena sanguinolenta]|nr:lysophospholipase I [Mycena sanguinolenta]
MDTNESAPQDTQPSAPPFITFPSTNEGCSATVVLLHGLGDTPQGILRLARLLRSRPGLNHIRFIVPAAPLRRLSATGQVTTAWFDIYSFELLLDTSAPGKDDEDGMRQSIACLDALLSDLVASGVDPRRMIMGGFSQGAAMSMLTGLTTATKLAGLFVLSGRLPLRNQMKSMVSPHASSIPIFWGHGTEDPLVTHELGRVSADFVISEFGIPPAPAPSLSTRILDFLGPNIARPLQPRATPAGLAFHSYHGLKHELGAEELDDLALWLTAVLPPHTEAL